jgi:acyl-CoA synthetase (AMP-forming)/AMP-acid ligase II/acyl carrier protein/thioesterase domain-containing protein
LHWAIGVRLSINLSGAAFEWPAGAPATLASLLLSRIDQNPDSQYFEIDQAGQRASQTTAEIYRRAMEILPQLRKRALAGESDIVLCFESVLDFIPAAWACICGGYSCVPWQMPKLANDGEIRSRLRALSRKLNDPLLIATDRIMRRIDSLKTWPTAILSVDPNLGQQFEATTLVQEAPIAAAIDGAVLMLTSGTTGDPKIAMLSHRSLLSRLFSRPELPAGHRRINCFPFDSVTGLWIIFPGPADTIYIQPDRLAAQPLELLNIADEFGVSAVSVSTSMAARTYEAAESVHGKYDLASLEHVGFGGEMIVANIILKFDRMLRQMGAHSLKVALGYGMTETGPLCHTPAMTLDQLTDHLRQDAAAVSVGSPAAGWSLRVVDDAGNALGAGGAGNIEVWSDTKLFSGYRNDLELTEASFTEDGWFKTGDVGIVAANGLTITGRQKATIIVNARNIALESIEAPVRQMEGIYGSLVAAAPVRLRDSATEELALFFVPRSDDIVDDLGRRIVRETARHSGVTVKHLVPLKASDFPLTPTGKVRRDVLAELYQSGKLAAHTSNLAGSAGVEHELTEEQRKLTALWRSVLKLKRRPQLHEDFFELGGDSLASAELIFAVEERFSCELPIEAFFERPTIANMLALLTQHTKSSPSRSASPGGTARLLRKLQSFSGSWQGQRLFGDSLVIGFNTDGYRDPIFWVCQLQVEASQLAKYLGPDQPLYAMRSCAEIVKPKDYTAEVLETVCNRYLWEILALPIGATIILGGTCQGGILALAMARRLKQMGRTPLLLALLEWSYSYGSYAEPVLLIYGEESYTADIYRQPETSKINWRDDFPRNVVASVPGKHAELERSDEGAACLAKLLNEQGRRRVAIQLAQSDVKVNELGAELAMREAKVKELGAKLAMREAEVKELRADLQSKAIKLRNRQLTASTSWRITAPLRAVSRGLGRLLARKSNRSNLSG